MLQKSNSKVALNDSFGCGHYNHVGYDQKQPLSLFQFEEVVVDSLLEIMKNV